MQDSTDLTVDTFDFDLPDQLIASYPLAERTQSRLLHLSLLSGQCADRQFLDLLTLLQPGDLLVLNDSRVIPARLWGRKTTGGQVEILIERITGTQTALAHIRASKAPQGGAFIELEQGHRVRVEGRQGSLFEITCLSADSFLGVLDQIGHIPLPGYMHRTDETLDKSRYQTVYANQPGSVAAPTAGLHFDSALLSALQKKGIRIARVMLHVGAGTFQPVRVHQLKDHHMHYEYLEVSEETVKAIEETKLAGGRVIAVGTTSVRSLETAAKSGILRPYQGETNLFIYPGYTFKVIDAMITNFHLPRSSLLMLVSAFGGILPVRAAYAHAIAEQYRFYSYGDAMFIA